MRTNDALHLGLMIVALAAAYLVPFELLLLSYVVLGPAHYFTEISWLHDRKFFLPHRAVALALVAVAVGAVLIDNASWFGFVMWAAFVVCAMMAGTSSAGEGTFLFMAAIGLSVLMYTSGSSFAVLGILLPTLIHVSLFTLVFMALGAVRSGSRAQMMLIVLYRHRTRAHSRRSAVGRSARAVVRESRPGVFRQCRAGAEQAVRHSGPAPRYKADQRSRLRLYLPLPELVHQSGRDPLGGHSAPAAGGTGRRERRFDGAVFLRLHVRLYVPACAKSRAYPARISAQQHGLAATRRCAGRKCHAAIRRRGEIKPVKAAPRSRRARSTASKPAKP